MNILIDHFSITSQVIFWLVFAILLGVTVWRAPWHHLKEFSSLNILLGMVVAVMVVWTLKAGFAPGLTIHLLGTTLLTLMFGWAFAILGISLVLVAHTINDGSGWMALPLEIILLGAVPAIFSYLLYRIVDSRLPNNFFIYIFIVAFFGAALSAAITVFATSLAQVASGVYSPDQVWHDYTRYALLIMFPEGFITGMLMTLFVAYRPEWVSTFDDSRYLDGK
ncbi:MAG: energy-coupling factor ABC transporter permease [Acidiferrobacterales bacterium]